MSRPAMDDPRRGEQHTRPRSQQSVSAWRRNIGKVAAARKLLTLVYYGLRDGHIRSLAAARPA
jgi:hypothetical protein